MKIKVADLEPNPYRDLENNYYDEERISGLMSSISKDEFWGGIPVRPHPTKSGKYQIGSGHHRLECLRRKGINEIDVNCLKDYTDSQMLRIMVNENAKYNDRTKLVNADIEKVRNKLQSWVDQYDTWEEARYDKNIITVFSSQEQWAVPKGRGVGRNTIIHYLGDTYKGWVIQAALATIKDGEGETIDREAVEMFPAIDSANKFRTAVKLNRIPKSQQKKVAEDVIKDKTTSRTRTISVAVAEHPLAKPKHINKPKLKPLPMLDDYIKEICGLMNTLYNKLNHIKDNQGNIQSRRLKDTFIRDGKELTELMKGIFEDATEAKKTRVLQNCG